MGIMDRALEAWDKKDAQGRYVVFPLGRFSRGRVVASTVELSRLKRHFKWVIYGQLALSAGAYVFLESRVHIYLLFFLFGAVGMAVIRLMFRRYPLANAGSDTRPPGYLESLKKTGYVYGRPALWTFFVMGLLSCAMMIAGIFYSWGKGDIENLVTFLVLACFLLSGTALFGWLIWVEKKERQQRPSPWRSPQPPR